MVIPSHFYFFVALIIFNYLLYDINTVVNLKKNVHLLASHPK